VNRIRDGDEEKRSNKLTNRKYLPIHAPPHHPHICPAFLAQEARAGGPRWRGRGRVCTWACIPINELINFIILEDGGDAPLKGAEVGVDLPRTAVEVGVPARSVSAHIHFPAQIWGLGLNPRVQRSGFSSYGIQCRG
jgi:hypothetical protein